MRPLGVTLIAIWLWIRCALGILLGLGFLFVGGLAGKLSSTVSSGTALPHFLLGLGAFLGIAVGGLSILTAAAGLGVWLMKNWGRILAIALAALSLLFSFRVLFHPHIGFSLAKLVIDVCIIGYLMMPEVKAKFS
jgi:uncharacterized membrane protein (DUF2068 family)